MSTAIRRILRSVIVLTAVALAFVGSSVMMTKPSENCSHEDELGTKVLEGETPVHVCLPSGAEALQSIESGKKSLVLILSEYRPPKSGLESLIVTMPDGREQVLGVFPAETFSCEDTDCHRRFFLTSPPNAISLDSSVPICVSVKFISPGGLARLALEMWPAPPK